MAGADGDSKASRSESARNSHQQLRSLNFPPSDSLPPISTIAEGGTLAPLPELRLPAAITAGDDGESGEAGAGAPGHGGGGPGVEGSVSARTYFRQQRDRMLMRGQEVRNFESVEIAFLTSYRLCKHFERARQERAKDAAEKYKKKSNDVRCHAEPDKTVSAEMQEAPVTEQQLRKGEIERAANRDCEFKWLELALKGLTTKEGHLSNDSIASIINRVGLHAFASDARIRLFCEWLDQPEAPAEEDPILHDILVGSEEATESASIKLEQDELGQGTVAESAEASQVEVDGTTTRWTEGSEEAEGVKLQQREEQARAVVAEVLEGENEKAARLRAEKTRHFRRRFKFDDPLAGEKIQAKPERAATPPQDLGPVYVRAEDFVRAMNKSKVFMSGSNEWGQLALGDNNCVTHPKAVFVPGEVDRVWAGGSQTWVQVRRAQVAVGSGGEVSITPVVEFRVAGRNEYGQLGLGHVGHCMHLTPVPALARAKIRLIALGAFHTLLMQEDGEVLACGWNRWGQLGTGDTVDRHHLTPVTALQGKQVVQLACGAGFSVALSSTFKIYTWGGNLAGQLGLGFLGGGRFPHFHEEHLHQLESRDGNQTASSGVSRPRGAGNVSSAGSKAGQQAPSPGGSKKRGISSPVTAQVQAGHASYCSRPCLVPGVMKLQGKSVACGGLHTVVLGAKGQLLAWGANHEGQAGVGRLDAYVPSPEKVYETEPAPEPITSETDRGLAKRKANAATRGISGSGTRQGEVGEPCVPQGAPATQVACGFSHTMMLTDRGELYACGASSYGQLGSYSTSSVLALTKLESIGYGSDASGPTQGHPVVQVRAGDFHTLARTVDGIWWSWGRNNRGQLGIGDRDASSLPQRVPKVLKFPPTGGAAVDRQPDEEPQELLHMVPGALHCVGVADPLM